MMWCADLKKYKSSFLQLLQVRKKEKKQEKKERRKGDTET